MNLQHELSQTDVMRKKIIQQLNKRVSNNRINVLDIGSNFIFTQLQELLKNKRINNVDFGYTPVDRKPAYAIFWEEVDDSKIIDKTVSKTDWIKRINSYCLTGEEDKFNPIDETEFYDSINLENFNTDAYDFCKKNEKALKFDFIILSDILHFIESKKADSIIEMCSNMLNKNGIILISVLNNIQTSYSRENLYSNTQWEKIKNRFETIEDNSTINKFYLIGKKKNTPLNKI